ncbi:hypothetical protein [Kocuria sp. ICS0012]|uniref:hypothetical protein n=1 Tax=Kocuria sp. ICS0012 TaxID=1834155 RepID=UPI0007EAA1D5|nr:hypothetical protein [Kocuria sp. ICS0012]OBA50212.1 hypothetical protein A5728_02860 [Kocuria sp. ICS0012]
MTQDVTLVVAVNITNEKTERVTSSNAQHATLFVSGRIITGYMIPAWQMMEQFGRYETGEPGGTGPYKSLAQIMKDREARATELTEKEDRTEEEQEFLDDFGPHFVNLADARWETANGSLGPDTGILLRVKIDSVDAWTPGVMTVSQTD